MFLQYLRPIYEPFRRLRNKWVQGKTMKGNVKMDVKRVQQYKNVGVNQAKAAHAKVGNGQAQAQAAQGQMQAHGGLPMQGHMPGGPPGAPGVPGASGMPGGAINPRPGIKKVGLFKKKHICEQCGQELDKTWDACPYCAQAAASMAAPSQKTQAFMIDAAGTGAPMQLLGWLVPLKGPQRGELYTLAPVTLVGTDPTCTVCLHDQFMSSRHAEIKAEGGVWVLKDLGSTNGTFVNDRRIDKQELIDNDVVKFGQSLVKFKSL